MKTKNRLEIENYLDSMTDLEVSAFETVDGLHLRTKIHKKYDQLTLPEKTYLQYADAEVVNNAKEIAEHLKKAYNFSLSKDPIEQWWWYLDKVADGELLIHFNYGTQIKDKAL